MSKTKGSSLATMVVVVFVGIGGALYEKAVGKMIRTIILALSFALAACTTTTTPSTIAGHQPGEEEAILAVMDAYMHEISANDLAAMDARQTPDGMTYRFVAGEVGGWDVVPHPNSYWVAPERADDHTYHERYWSPTVMIRGAMALVWAPYEFQIDGKTAHCGVDVFSFAKIGGVWKVSNAMWTVEPSACTELRPENPGVIRPSD